MRLTQWTDYTLRVLMYCAAAQDRPAAVTITEVADAYDISRSHLTKIVQQLGATGLLETSRGRGGGMRLRRAPSDINLGAVVRATETDFHLVECFDLATNHCRLTPHCGLRGILAQAMHAFMQVIDQYTLADLMKEQSGPPSDAQPMLLTRMVPGKLHAPEVRLVPARSLPRSNPAQPEENRLAQQTAAAPNGGKTEKIPVAKRTARAAMAQPAGSQRR